MDDATQPCCSGCQAKEPYLEPIDGIWPACATFAMVPPADGKDRADGRCSDAPFKGCTEIAGCWWDGTLRLDFSACSDPPKAIGWRVFDSSTGEWENRGPLFGPANVYEIPVQEQVHCGSTKIFEITLEKKSNPVALKLDLTCTACDAPPLPTAPPEGA